MWRRVSRRALLLGGVVAIPSASLAQNYPWRPNQADWPTPIEGSDLRFFRPDEAAFIEAAIDRLIPPDDTGPGAREAGVALFIDRQLAGGYGMGERTYLHEPFAAGAPSQGWQMHAPAVVYREAIAAVDEYATRTAGAPFTGLNADAQTHVLHQLEGGQADLRGAVSGKAFFDLLWQNTIEGYFSDPLYGGNRGMAGWSMIGFPGARYDYREQLAAPGARLQLQPVSIMRAR